MLGGEKGQGGCYRGARREWRDAFEGWAPRWRRGVIKRVDRRGLSSGCFPRHAGPAFRRHTSGGAAAAEGRGRAAAGGGGIGWARPAVRAGAEWAGCCCPGLCGPRGPSVPPAPWAIATRWGPTRRWWFQVRGQRGRWVWDAQGLEGVCGGGCAWEGGGRAGERTGRGQAGEGLRGWGLSLRRSGPHLRPLPGGTPPQFSHLPCSAP